MSEEAPALKKQKTMQAAMLDEIAAMMAPSGYEYIIVCCSNQSAENFWQARLEKTILEVTGQSAKVLCVHEDWNGGAGNGLGTLYAFQKACAKNGDDLVAAMEAGASVAIYHTAGKGTRMAPLPGAENNNKPGVKLPGLLTIEGTPMPITVLESVMRQTSSYAAARKGRCSVYWGDQIFVPSCGIQPSSYPADILAALRPMPSKSEWEAEQLHQYGLIAVDGKGDSTQLEKVTYETAVDYLPPDVLKVGTSLGSFSLSAALTKALLAEFAPELAAKTASLDSDPHFWMPLTLAEANYVAVMGKKGVDAAEATAHYARMGAFWAKFKGATGWTAGALGCVDVGREAYWWDYGRLELYMTNNLFVTDGSASAHALRVFMKLHAAGAAASDTSGRRQANALAPGVEVDPSAVVLNCKLGGGRVGPGCVLVNVVAPSVDLDGCVLVNVTSTAPVAGKGGLLYNVVHEGRDALPCSAVRADVFMPGGVHHVMNSALSIDGGKAWKVVVEGNPLSFEGVYKANQPLDVSECTAEATVAHKALRSTLTF